jgi:hypothetical protein
LSATPTLDPGVPYLWFALYKELEDCGQDDEAWKALVHGCTARRRAIDYDPTTDQALFDRLIETCTPEFLVASRRRRRKAPSPSSSSACRIRARRWSNASSARIRNVRDAGELQDFPFQMAWAGTT